MSKKIHLNCPIDKDSLDLSGCLQMDGSVEKYISNNLDTFHTGIILAWNCSTAPDSNPWLIIAGGMAGLEMQVAFPFYNLSPPKIRINNTGTWTSWSNTK